MRSVKLVFHDYMQVSIVVSIKQFLLVAIFTVVGALARAADPAPSDAAADAILAKLRAAHPDLQYGKPKRSPLPGFYEVRVTGGPILYVNAEATHFIAGDLFLLGKNGFVNIAEQQRERQRIAMLASVPKSEMIIFAPEKVKATVTVFTDVDCGYCRKFHQEVPELNRMGIAVQYLAFPRAGPGSPTYRKLATAWCAKDRNDALTRFKNGENVPLDVCEGNSVIRQMSLGEQMGVTGTPALILENGTLVPGYHPAKELARLMGVK
jgi:thiol:disulfide interchange protein DsbC